MPKTTQEMLESFIRMADEDDIGLWQIMSRVSVNLGIRTFQWTAAEQDKLIQGVVDFVPLLLQNGFVAGNIENKTNYVIWPDQSSAYVTNRIKKEWLRRKGAMPSVGFIAYFRKK